MDRNDIRAREILIAAWEESNKDAASLIQRGLVDEKGIDHDWVTIPLRAITAALRESEWRPIESAPKDGTRVLIAGGTQSFGMHQDEPFSGVSIAYWYDGYDAHWRGEDMQAHDEWYEHKPTHWMPLPPPPAIDAARKEGV